MTARDRRSYLGRRFRRVQSLVNRREQSLVRRLLARIPGQLATILDIPCGYGRFTPLLGARARERLVCCDRRPERIRALVEAERACSPEACGRRLAPAAADLYSLLPFRERSFDLVFCFRFFHHVHDDARRAHAICEIARAAARWVLFSYYDSTGLHRAQKHLWRAVTHRSIHVTMHPRRSFLGLFAPHGFRVVAECGVLPGIHAHRLVLLERTAHVDPLSGGGYDRGESGA